MGIGSEHNGYTAAAGADGRLQKLTLADLAPTRGTAAAPILVDDVLAQNVVVALFRRIDPCSERALSLMLLQELWQQMNLSLSALIRALHELTSAGVLEQRDRSLVRIEFARRMLPPAGMPPTLCDKRLQWRAIAHLRALDGVSSDPRTVARVAIQA